MTQTEKLSLEIKRFIKAPQRDRVYAAWTDLAQLETENGSVENVRDSRAGGGCAGRWKV